MGNLITVLAVANPLFTGLLTLLFFLESQKSKKRFEDLSFNLENQNGSLVRATKDDFTSVSKFLETLSLDVNQTTKSMLDAAKMIERSSVSANESYKDIIKSNAKIHDEFSKSMKLLNEKLESSNSLSIKSNEKINDEFSKSMKLLNEKLESSNSLSIKSNENLHQDLFNSLSELKNQIESNNQTIKNLSDSLDSITNL